MLNFKVIETGDEHSECLNIRRIVFIEGQNVPKELELDDKDATCTHILCQKEDRNVGTLRICFDNDTAKIERVAVLDECRGQGVGFKMMEFAMDKISARHGIKKMKLGSQTHAIAFYQKLGFVVHGDEYVEVGAPHLDMIKEVK